MSPNHRSEKFTSLFHDSFLMLLEQVIEERKDLNKTRDSEYRFVNNSGREIVYRQIAVSDSQLNTVYVSFYKNGNYLIQGSTESELGKTVQELITNALRSAEFGDVDLDNLARDWGYKDWEDFDNSNDPSD